MGLYFTVIGKVKILLMFTRLQYGLAGTGEFIQSIKIYRDQSLKRLIISYMQSGVEIAMQDAILKILIRLYNR